MKDNITVYVIVNADGIVMKDENQKLWASKDFAVAYRWLESNGIKGKIENYKLVKSK